MRAQFLVQNMPSNDNISSFNDNKNSINSIQIQKNFLSNKRESKDSVAVTIQSLQSVPSQKMRPAQTNGTGYQQTNGQVPLATGPIETVQSIRVSQQTQQAQQLIRKPASITIQHPQQFANQTSASLSTVTQANLSQTRISDPKGALLIEQLAAQGVPYKGNNHNDQLGAGNRGQKIKPINNLRHSSDNFQKRQRTPTDRDNLNKYGSQNQMVMYRSNNKQNNLQATSGNNYSTKNTKSQNQNTSSKFTPTTLNQLMHPTTVSQADPNPKKAGAIKSPTYSQKSLIPPQKHISLSPVRKSSARGQGAGPGKSKSNITGKVLGNSSMNNNGGGHSHRNRLMTENSNPRDSSQDQINSIRDFAVSQGMTNHQQHNSQGNYMKEQQKMILWNQKSLGAQYGSNSQSTLQANVLRNSTNSIQDFQRIYQQNQQKIDQIISQQQLQQQQTVSQLQKANAKINDKSVGASTHEKHKKTKSIGVPASFSNGKNTSGFVTGAIGTSKQMPNTFVKHATKKNNEYQSRKGTRSNSNKNGAQVPANFSNHTMQQLGENVKKGLYNNQLNLQNSNKIGSESVDSGTGTGKTGTRQLNKKHGASTGTSGPGSRHHSSRSNKNIQKFQTQFPSSFNSNVKHGMQYQNDNHGQSGVSIGISNGSNSALDKLERQTANFGQVLAGAADRSSKIKPGCPSDQKSEFVGLQFTGVNKNAVSSKSNIKMNFAPDSSQVSGSNNSTQLASKFQSSVTSSHIFGQINQNNQPTTQKQRVKTENSNNKLGKGGSKSLIPGLQFVNVATGNQLPPRRQGQSSEDLMRQQHFSKAHPILGQKYQSVIQRPIHRQTKSHKISPKGRENHITIPIISEENTSRTNKNSFAMVQQPRTHTNKSGPSNVQANGLVPASSKQSTPVQVSEHSQDQLAAYVSSSHVQVPTTSSQMQGVQQQDIGEDKVVLIADPDRFTDNSPLDIVTAQLQQQRVVPPGSCNTINRNRIENFEQLTIRSSNSKSKSKGKMQQQIQQRSQPFGKEQINIMVAPSSSNFEEPNQIDTIEDIKLEQINRDQNSLISIQNQEDQLPHIQQINNFFHPNDQLKDSKTPEVQAVTFSNNLKNNNGASSQRDKPKKEQKLIDQIINNYHNLDAQAQNYILKLFMKKNKVETKNKNNEDGEGGGHLQNYFDVSLNQSGSATTFRQSELVQEQVFDSNQVTNPVIQTTSVFAADDPIPTKEKDTPQKKRSQAKQVDFMNKGHKLTKQIPLRKHKSKPGHPDPTSPQRPTEDLVAKPTTPAETVDSDDRNHDSRDKTILVNLGTMNKPIQEEGLQAPSQDNTTKEADLKTSEGLEKTATPQIQGAPDNLANNLKIKENEYQPSSATPTPKLDESTQNQTPVVQVVVTPDNGETTENPNDVPKESLVSKNSQNEVKLEMDDTTFDQDQVDRFYIPKNVVTKYAFATRVGYIPMNPNKVNQDTYILGPCIEGPENNSKHMFGVNDGHGQFGHHVSGFIKEQLLAIVKDMLSRDHSDPNSDPYDEIALAKKYEDLLQSAFLKCDQRLQDISDKSKEQDSDIDPFDLRLSGSTVNTVFFDGTSVHCANAGDSRAIKVKLTYDENSKLVPICEPLSEDHKPDLEKEKARILGMGGRIDTFHDTQNNNEPIGPYRVWLKHEELPGLAMSRSLGDKVAHSVGVSSLPEVKTTYLGVDDKFIVIGTDGVWEFLSNEQIADIVLPYYQMNQPEAAANAIVKEAYKQWREQEEVVDDITTVVIFVEPYMAYRQIDYESKQQERAGGRQTNRSSRAHKSS